MKVHIRRRALLALPGVALLAGCETASQPPAIVQGPALGVPSVFGPVVTLTTTLPSRVPLRTALALQYGASRSGYGSLFTYSSSGQVMRLFENRSIIGGRLIDFPNRIEPVIRFDEPAGAETFILVFTIHSFRWLAPADFADTTPFARLRLDPNGFESRLAAALASLPAGTYAVQRLTILTF